MRQLLSAMLAVFALAVPAAAQEGLPDPAMLVADEVVLTADRRLIARGNVEALYQGRRLTAREIVRLLATKKISTPPLRSSRTSTTCPAPAGTVSELSAGLTWLK